MKNKIEIDRSWTLFLDRDGVINHRKIDGYIQSVDEFDFLPGIPKSITVLTKLFGRIIVVTNQQGIGKGFMSEQDLEIIHKHMLSKIELAGGKIDRIYYCPHLASDNCNCRKPATGMAIAAQEDFPEIEFTKSMMVGDTITDMEFGKRLGMISVGIGVKGDYSLQGLQTLVENM